jgi:hypothetical protein
VQRRVDAIDSDSAGIGQGQRHQRLEQRRFACAVRAEQSEKLSAMHAERNVAQRRSPRWRAAMFEPSRKPVRLGECFGQVLRNDGIDTDRWFHIDEYKVNRFCVNRLGTIGAADKRPLARLPRRLAIGVSHRPPPKELSKRDVAPPSR